MGRPNQEIRGCKMVWATTLVALLCALGNGCSTDDTSSGDAVTNWCSAYCAWQRACGNALAVSCRSACISNDGFSSYGRPEFYAAMGSCLQQDSRCAGGTEASWEACYEEASLQIPLTQAAFDFCESMGGVFFECGYGGSPVTCARGYISLSDDVLGEITSCSNTTCDTYTDCITSIAYGGT